MSSHPASITSPIHNWVFFLLWLHPFILSVVISPLISSSILGIYWPGEFLFQYPIILPSHTVHGVFKARILKWFSIPFSSGPHSVRTLHHDLTILDGPTQHGLVLAMDHIELWPRGDTPRPSSGVATESTRLRQCWSGSREELPHIREWHYCNLKTTYPQQCYMSYEGMG